MRLQQLSSIVLTCMIALLCSTPLTTFAQQQKHKAITQAEFDAKNDINTTTWMVVGACVPIISATTGILAAYTFGSTTSDTNQTPGGYGFGSPNIYGFLGGAGLVLCSTYLLIYNQNNTPPPERLIGKSPEYIKLYTETYQKTMRSQRIKSALKGTSCLFAVPSLL